MSGMDSSPMTSMIGAFHAGLGDTLWFAGWTPTSAGSTFAASLGLFLLAVFSRLLGAVRRAAEAGWRQRAFNLLEGTYGATSNPLNSSRPRRESSTSTDSDNKATDSPIHRAHRWGPQGSSRFAGPFIPAHDIPRGVLQAFQSAISYFLMLAVMTMNCWYFIVIILGIGVGEMAWGRFGAASANDH